MWEFISQNPVVTRHRREGRGSLGAVARRLPAGHRRRASVLQAIEIGEGREEEGASRLSGGQAFAEAGSSIETEATRNVGLGL